jgi:pyruvate-ferredoxin/flavodoxin oxidoreductase
MAASRRITVEGNEAAASVAHRLSEVIAIYPITPSSRMGELADEWSARGKKNLWGAIPQVSEMQSEGGAIGAVHGALQAGSMSTTFTASQGLLLMIPNMYKIAGELLPFCMHVSARTVATHALSIFGDHSDVMACRQTGFAMIASNSVQEAQDIAAIGHAATLRSRVPFLHFFDGFRTSHEVAKIDALSDADLAKLVDDDLVRAIRARALTPDHPVIRGTAQNPDAFFQAREACNPYYDACAEIVRKTMDDFAAITGRRYDLFEYVGHPEAERVIVMMGSGAEAAQEAIEWLLAKGERVGLVKVRLYRPFASEAFVRTLPKTTRSIAVLDRTKEPGAVGEPLYLDVVTALYEVRGEAAGAPARLPLVIGGRYGLSSKEFTPAMVKAVFDELRKDAPKRHFTVGIVDDVTHTSLDVDPEFDVEQGDVVRAVFYGLGADGTVSANKNSLKIIGDAKEGFVQGYFVYDSKKSGAITVSHLRFSPRFIRSSYLIRQASFVACHQWSFLDRYDMLAEAAPGGVFLVNAPFPAEQVWNELPVEVQDVIIQKHLRLFAVDAYSVAKEAGMGSRINGIMQTCFFAISGVLPREEAIAKIKAGIEKAYGARGAEVLRRNFIAVDKTIEHLHEIPVPSAVTSTRRRPPIVPPNAPDFVSRVTALMLANKGDLLPVSAFPVDGTWPLGTAKWEKRGIALDIPVWDESICIQCNKCAMVCPHAAIRTKVYPPAELAKAPAGFKSMDYKASDFPGSKYTVQVAPEDCTGCTLCVVVCPAKDKANPRHKSLDMAPALPIRDVERERYAYFLDLPEADRTQVKIDVKNAQFFEPLFEYSGACSGCGETPYVKLLTQLFGDRLLVANATGCSSIYGGNLPTTPYTTNRDGRGPAWANSLFEDNAEFGLGYRLALDAHTEHAKGLLKGLSERVGTWLVDEMLAADQHGEAGIAAQRGRVEALRKKLAEVKTPEAVRLAVLADYLVQKSVWIVGGDGWAYDIGYGGLDHVLSMGRKVNVLVLDTEVYSNTGGQASKATPMGAAAKFASLGKEGPKKDLGMMAMAYGNVYVAQIAFGAKDNQTVQALAEADSYPGPSLVIAYSHCIAHGYDMSLGLDQQKLAVQSAYWPLYRFDPRRVEKGESPLKIDSGPIKATLEQYTKNEGRFHLVERLDKARYEHLMTTAQERLRQRFSLYERIAEAMTPTGADKPAPKAE